MFRRFKNFLDYVPYRIKCDSLRGFCVYRFYMSKQMCEGAVISIGKYYIELLDLNTMLSKIVSSTDFNEDIVSWETLGVVENCGDFKLLEDLPIEVRNYINNGIIYSKESLCINERG